MQMNQVQDKFTRAERCIEQASMACQSAAGVLESLRNCLSDLDRQVHDSEALIRQAQSDSEVRECIDTLEELGDRAMQECRSASGVDSQLKDAVKAAHKELSELKRQLH